MLTRIQILILLTIFSLFVGTNIALALDIPDFPNCTNPQGVVKVQYPSGTHGIVGDSAAYMGSDSVYQLDSGNLIQCFCSVDGQGIQTNWWRDSSLPEEDKQTLLNLGWIFVPNGALWGLEKQAYFAKNSTYSCAGNVGGSGGGGQAGGNDGGDGLGCAVRDCSNQGAAGEVLGISTALAATGGAFLPFVLALIGVLAVTFGVILNLRSSRK